MYKLIMQLDACMDIAMLAVVIVLRFVHESKRVQYTES